MSKSQQSNTNNLEESIDVFTDEEIALLDKYHAFTDNKFDDDEIYDVIVSCNFGDSKILSKLKEMKRDLKKGEDYEWHEIEKPKQIISNGNHGTMAKLKQHNSDAEQRENTYQPEKYYYNNHKYNGYQYNNKYYYNGYTNYNNNQGYKNDRTQWRNYRNKRKNFNQYHSNKTQYQNKNIEVELPSQNDTKEEVINENTNKKERDPNVAFQVTINFNKKDQPLVKEEFNQINIVIENKDRDKEEEDDIFDTNNNLIEKQRLEMTNQIETSYTKPEVALLEEKISHIKEKEPIKEKKAVLSIATNVSFTLENIILPKRKTEPVKVQVKDNNMQFKAQTYFQPQAYSPYNGYDMGYMMPEISPHELNNPMMQQPMYYPYFYYPMADPNQRNDFGNMKQNQQQQSFYRSPQQYNMPPPYIPYKKP